jgi:hypothetical protein
MLDFLRFEGDASMFMTYLGLAIITLILLVAIGLSARLMLGP